MYDYGPGFRPESRDLQFDVSYPERLSRLLIFIKWLLIIPNAIVVGILTWAVGLVTVIAWFGILITGRYPASLWGFSARVLAWQARTSVYYSLMRDEYPPFALDAPDYPVRFDLQYPERQSRLLIFFRWLLIIPHTIIMWLLSLFTAVVYFIAWFAILFTGQYPRGLFNYMVGFYRWYYRVMAYAWFLTDAYPPFNFDGDMPSGSYIPPGPYAPVGGYPGASPYGAPSFAGAYGGSPTTTGPDTASWAYGDAKPDTTAPGAYFGERPNQN